MTIWAHIRLAGNIILLLGLFFRNMTLGVLGFCIMGIGVVNALYFLEKRVKDLEDQNVQK